MYFTLIVKTVVLTLSSMCASPSRTLVRLLTRSALMPTLFNLVSEQGSALCVHPARDRILWQGLHWLERRTE